MPGKKLNVDWNRQLKSDINPMLSKFENYLRYKGYSPVTSERYLALVKAYLSRRGNQRPTVDDAIEFRAEIANSNYSRATLNLYSAAIKSFHKMNGEEVDLPYLKLDNKLPYYLTAENVLEILSGIRNLKHYAMISLCFYCMLRASELCALSDSDLDLKNLTLRVRSGKGRKDAILPVNPDCANVLRQYLEIRPKVVLPDGSIPVFPSDFSNRWNRRSLHRMFCGYKRAAHIDIPGGTHLLRHSAASILLKNGADIMTVKELMRHVRLETTARYLHLGQGVREKYNQCLTLR